MRKILNWAFGYMLVGVASGLFYREFTKLNDFPAGEFTQLGLAHTHLLTLGFIVLLVVLLLERAFELSARRRLFAWFFGIYNAGVILTSTMLIVHGMLTVRGVESSAMIAGFAGLGHMLLSAGMVLLFVLLRSRVPASRKAEPVTGRSVTG
ncbi:DUF2871 domain-containing protein [Glutamicibacter sp. MNS18]|uniref:DUF2871 domain-containing protein n=1 Tax=Glutamicibacter sp. MNS18 TaxID=2989817 RepID=UPI0022366A5E|nr:DUF2871 domain-containing protein [Glutamicibacter sp. MNS18]MCW4467045.1 DUF2871 domain-containing protein [Glutamicibacter sp. MNS18]